MISMLIALFVEVIPVELRVQTDAVPERQAVEIFRAVERRFRRQLGVTLALDTVRTVPPRFAPDSFQFWAQNITTFQVTSSWKWNRTVVLVAPPVALDARRWLGGASAGVCTYPWALSLAVVSMDALKPYASEIVLAHELAHLLGAEHGTGIMQPDPGPLLAAGKRLRFSKASRNQISDCMDG